MSKGEFDSPSKPSNDQYRDNWDRIFGQTSTGRNIRIDSIAPSIAPNHITANTSQPHNLQVGESITITSAFSKATSKLAKVVARLELQQRHPDATEEDIDMLEKLEG